MTGPDPEQARPAPAAGRAPSHHLRNMGYLGAVEALWGAGMNVVSQGTVLPVFLERLGASYRTIGALPALSALGAGLPQALTGFVTGRSRRLKGWVIGLHLAAPIPLLLLAGGLAAGWPALGMTLVLWGLFFALLGLLFPLWLDYMAAILDPGRRGRAFGLIFFVQTAAGAGGVTLAAWLLQRDGSLGVYAVLFFLAWAAMTGGSLFFLGTREIPATNAPPARLTLGAHLRGLRDLALDLPWFWRYMTARWLVRGIYPLLLHFYAVYAVKERGVTPAQAALFGTAGLVAQALAGLAAGAAGDRFGHKVPVMVGQAALMGGCLLSVLPIPGWTFALVAALAGIFLATEYTSQTNWIIDLGGSGRRQALLSLIGFLLTPASVLTPLAGGVLMDGVGYRPVIAAGGIAVGFALLAVARGVPSGRPPA